MVQCLLRFSVLGCCLLGAIGAACGQSACQTPVASSGDRGEVELNRADSHRAVQAGHVPSDPKGVQTRVGRKDTSNQTTSRSAASGVKPVRKDSGSSGVDSEAIQEILRIRKQQGSPLDGTIFGDLSSGGQDPFADVLREVAGTSRARKRQHRPAADPAAARIHAETGLPTRLARVPTSSRRPDPRVKDQDPLDARLDIVLRRATWLLGRKANRLQQQEQTHQADRLRALADQIQLLMAELPAESR